MMTDLQKLLSLFDEFGIGYDVINYDNGTTVELIRKEGNAKITGYYDFRADFEFDKESKFIEVGIWE